MLEVTAELVIILDGNSWLGGRGIFFRPEVCFHFLRRIVVQTFGNEYLVAADFNHYHALFGQPGMASAQGSPRIRRRRVLRNFAIGAQALSFLISLRERRRLHGSKLRRFRGT